MSEVLEFVRDGLVTMVLVAIAIIVVAHVWWLTDWMRGIKRFGRR